MRKIAVVEDEESLQSVLVEWLKSEGYDAYGITTGREAIERIPALQPDLVLLDLILPELSGFEVIADLRKRPETAGIPIIVVSNFGEVENRQKAMALGATNFLVKAEHTLESMKKIIEETLSGTSRSRP